MSSCYKVRFEVVFLVNHPKGPKMTVSEAARYTRKSESFVRKWIQRYQATGTVDDQDRSGRPSATTFQEDKVIEKLFKDNPGMTPARAKDLLNQKGITISVSTIRRRLKEKGYSLKSTVPKPLLGPSHIQKRLQWAQENVDRDWSNVIFTDESTFCIDYPLKRVWAKERTAVIQRTVKHPQKVHVWGCFCSKGFGRLICFTETLNAKGMLKLYNNGLLPSARSFFGNNNNNWILQEDNDPKHNSTLCRTWKHENGIQRMDWPSQSPDANPIENVWALMKCKLKGKRFKTTKQFTRALQKIWKELSADYAVKLVESCTRRCQAIIDNCGDWTSY